MKVTATSTRALEIMLEDGTVNGIPLDAWSVHSHSIGQATKRNLCSGGLWYSGAGPTLSFPTSIGPFIGKTYARCQYQGPGRLLVVSIVQVCLHGPIAAKCLRRRMSVTTATDTILFMRRLNVSSEFGAAVDRMHGNIQTLRCCDFEGCW